MGNGRDSRAYQTINPIVRAKITQRASGRAAIMTKSSRMERSYENFNRDLDAHLPTAARADAGGSISMLGAGNQPRLVQEIRDDVSDNPIDFPLVANDLSGFLGKRHDKFSERALSQIIVSGGGRFHAIFPLCMTHLNQVEQGEPIR
jgi:hypothetical protein